MQRKGLRIPGFRTCGVRAGIKARGLDLALLVADEPAAVAGVFTRSSVVGAPVELCRRRVRSGRSRGVVVNSGCSNVAMGERGRRDAAEMARRAALAVGAAPAEMLVASSGVIGQPLPMARSGRGIAAAAAALSETGLARAAEAIRTTDTFSKLAQASCRLGGRRVTIAGIAKGSGMIEPNMGTLLGFLLTDAAASPAYLRGALRRAADASFNRVTVDGETSTSDTLLLFASGAAGNCALRSAQGRDARAFEAALAEVSISLARDVARDGEGATRLVTVVVREARTPAEAERAARRIANSLLVKTALFGGDANWGRILQTVGAGRIRLALERTQVRLAGVVVFRQGASTGPAARARAARAMRAKEIELEVRLGAGRAQAQVWTCDLSYDYVRINADYTT
ncbi:MAG: bifunctional glutamate N-acetyltransferase/amino-acid acetyltransferase ArgJ [Candidatus Limnocylindria bacterium]